MSKITVYFAEWCGSCKAITPKIKAYARRNGIAFEKIDVDKCTTKTCNSVDYIPHILMDGQLVSDRQLEKMIK